MADRKYQKRMMSKFLQVFLTTFALLMVIIAIGTFAYSRVAQRNLSTPVEGEDYSETDFGDKIVDGEIVNPFGDKKMTTFAVFGVDKDRYRTDVTMLVFFNHESAKLDIISVPRDTKVQIPDDVYAEIQARRSDVSDIVKINEVPAYVPGEQRNEVSVAVLEKSLGIDVDYYINMNLDVFRKIVDIIGGVPMNIPFDMEYNDPFQDLYINLKAGEQVLNGARAEQLIRYRSGYANGDLGRIEMQHEFMNAFMNQLLNTKNRINMINIVSEVLKNVQTNFDRSVDYLVFLDRLDPSNIDMHMLPGEADNSGRSYYLYDYDATKELLNQIVNQPYIEAEISTAEEGVEPATEPVVDVQPSDIVDVKSMNISVQNGIRLAGFAGRTKEMLEDEGYTVAEAIDYETKPVQETEIHVPDMEAFEVLKVYFKDPDMVLAPAMMDEEIQIVIVLGDEDRDD